MSTDYAARQDRLRAERDWDDLAHTQALKTATGFITGVALALGYSDRIGEGPAWPADWERYYNELVDGEYMSRLANLWWSHSDDKGETRGIAADSIRLADSRRRGFVEIMQRSEVPA